ncbi:MAG: hypothetical protein HYZ45_13710 [Burkholderiales bacterium]|nr:hypothetical protein [Burkholderiales bacterium]
MKGHLMLIEIKHVRQSASDVRKRWFTSPDLDLTLWYDKQDSLLGWQFCYDKMHDEHALSWYAQAGYSHTSVDDGESHGALKFKSTPVIAKNKAMDKERVLALFVDNSQQLPPDIAQLLRQQIAEYG